MMLGLVEDAAVSGNGLHFRQVMFWTIQGSAKYRRAIGAEMYRDYLLADSVETLPFSPQIDTFPSH